MKYITCAGINDLVPEGESLQLKFMTNTLVTGNVQHPREIAAAVRIARVNHACQPNTATIYDETARVAILFAVKDIQPGEEITTCYHAPFFCLSNLTAPYPGMNPELNIDEEFNFIKNKILAGLY